MNGSTSIRKKTGLVVRPGRAAHRAQARHALLGVAALAAALLTGACGHSATGPAGATLSAAEARDLATTVDGTGDTVVGDQTAQLDASPATTPLADIAATGSPAADVLTASTTFHTQRDCRLGGSLTVDGQIDHTLDTSTHTLTADFQATFTHDHCVRNVRGTDITITGAPNLQLAAHRQRVNLVLTGLQTLSLTGSFTWEKPDGTSGTCDVDIQGKLDPSTHTRTIDGTFCNTEIHQTLTWNGTSG